LLSKVLVKQDKVRRNGEKEVETFPAPHTGNGSKNSKTFHVFKPVSQTFNKK
jgi:hypothetical protein